MILLYFGLILAILGHPWGLLTVYIYVGIMTFQALLLGEIAIIKLLYVTKFSKMALLDDKFLFTILTQINCLIVFTGVSIRIYLGEPYQNFHFQFFYSRGIPLPSMYPELTQWYKLMVIW